MTSKEALKDISYLLLNEVDELKNKDIWKNNIGIIEKDLELLDILKKHTHKKVLCGFRQDGKLDYDVMPIEMFIWRTEKDYQRIKEWLENDK